MGVHDADYKKVKKLLGIPEDEPIFILRAQDKLAAPTIQRYRNFADGITGDDKAIPRPDQEWFNAIDAEVENFLEWGQANTTKVPD